MKKTLFRMLAVGCMAISLVSCKKDNDEASQNVIEDASGLNVTLNWSHTDGSNALNSDLDVYFYQGSGTITEITSGTDDTQFENIDIPAGLPDGEYTFIVDHYLVSANGAYTLKVSGKSVAKTYERKNVAFTTANQNEEKSVLRVNKAGNKYTFTNL